MICSGLTSPLRLQLCMFLLFPFSYSVNFPSKTGNINAPLTFLSQWPLLTKISRPRHWNFSGVLPHVLRLITWRTCENLRGTRRGTQTSQGTRAIIFYKTAPRLLSLRPQWSTSRIPSFRRLDFPRDSQHRHTHHTHTYTPHTHTHHANHTHTHTTQTTHTHHIHIHTHTTQTTHTTPHTHTHTHTHHIHTHTTQTTHTTYTPYTHWKICATMSDSNTSDVLPMNWTYTESFLKW